MTREIISIAAGQCGNQLNYSFWEKMCNEHGIEPDGSLKETPKFSDRKDVFFYQSDYGRYIPRSVLLDLEPRVVNTVQNSKFGGLFNPENIFVPEHNGSGAGNNWARGYSLGQEHLEVMVDILDREAENSDSLEAFMLSHAVAGGTGSGLGSLMLETIKERFPKKILQTVSLFPDQRSSDVVVQPYNTILTLRRLIENVDSVLVYDNTALLRIAADIFSGQKRAEKVSPTMEQVNELVSTSLAAFTAPIRFPGYLYTNLTSIVSAAIPVPEYHFLMPTYTPFIAPNVSIDTRRVRKTTINEIQRRLIQSKYSMIAVTPTALQNSKYLSLMQMIRGNVPIAEFRKGLLNYRDREDVRFCQNSYPSPLLSITEWSPFVEPETKLSGLGLLNSTAVSEPLKKNLHSFEKLYSKGAFVKGFLEEELFQNSLDEFDLCRETVKNYITNYKKLDTYGI